MRHWSIWDRIAYLVFLVGALILAADSGLRISPQLADAMPLWMHSPIWGFAPLALMLLATIMWIANFSGLFAIFGPRLPVRFFLERDSSTNLRGIQTFPNINYIQISVTTSRRIENCTACITRIEYDVGNQNYAVEFGERFPIPWSKSEKSNNLEYDLEPGHPPIRLNAAKFDSQILMLDPGTPTNLLPLFQRLGWHRLTIFFSGTRANGTKLNETHFLEILWSGPGSYAFVRLQERA